LFEKEAMRIELKQEGKNYFLAKGRAKFKQRTMRLVRNVAGEILKEAYRILGTNPRKETIL
jgi:hypothetical protein